MCNANQLLTCSHFQMSMLLYKYIMTVTLKCLGSLHFTSTYMYIPFSLIVTGIPNPDWPITPQLPLTSTSSPMSPDNTEYYTGIQCRDEIYGFLWEPYIFDYHLKVVEAVLFC